MVSFQAMKLLRKDTDYALAAVAFLAKHAEGRRFSATELASALDLPHGFLRKILKTLSREGIVCSTPGKGGGFALAKKSRDVTVYSVMKAVQGPIHGTECAVNKHVCGNTHACRVRQIMGSIEKQLRTELSRIPISDLIDD